MNTADMTRVDPDEVLARFRPPASEAQAKVIKALESAEGILSLMVSRAVDVGETIRSVRSLRNWMAQEARAYEDLADQFGDEEEEENLRLAELLETSSEALALPTAIKWHRTPTENMGESIYDTDYGGVHYTLQKAGDYHFRTRWFLSWNDPIHGTPLTMPLDTKREATAYVLDLGSKANDALA